MEKVDESFEAVETTQSGRPLGSRESHRAKRTEEIMAASIRVLGEGGYAAFSLRKVAAAAGVRLNTVQHFYGDLHSLLIATVQAKINDYVERYRAVASDYRLSARDRLEAVLDDTFAEVRKTDVAAFFLEAWALGNQEPAVAAVLKAIYIDYYKTLGQMAQQINPDLSEVDARIVASIIGSITEGALIYARFGDDGIVPLGAVMVRMKTLCLSLVSSATPGKLTNVEAFA